MNKDEYEDSPNMEQEFNIKKAKPDYNEGLVFAKLYDRTAEGFFSKMLGEAAYEIVAEAFVKPNNEYSYENVAFAVKGEDICGMVSGYTVTMKRNFQNSILTQSTKGKKRDIQRFHFVSSLLMRAIGAKHPGEYYVQAIFVLDNHRGKGLGQKLMRWIESDAIEKEAQTIALDVSSKNKSAIDLYRRQGLTVDSRWPRFRLLPSIFTRMSKNLRFTEM